MSFTSATEIEPDIVRVLKPNVLRPCVNRPSRGYNSIRPYALTNLNDLKIQQGLIIKDLLFVFLGLEGFYVRYNEKFDPFSIDSKIRGPDFKTAKHLDISLKSITKRLVRFGKYYSGLKSFKEYYNSHLSGKVLQKFCFEIDRFLQEYEKLILTIEEEFQLDPNFNLNYLENNIIRNNNISHQIDLLYEVALKIHDESVLRHFQMVGSSGSGEDVETTGIARKDDTYFQNFIKTIQNDLRQTGSIDLATDQSNFELCKGGLVLQIIQKLNSEHYLGDVVKNTLLNQLFDSISKDYVEMLNGWLRNGEIDDPFDEFLIKENKIKESTFLNKFTEKYWEEVYVTRIDGVIDQFQSRDLQLKILATGRYLNIFKMCTGINDTNAMDNGMSHIEITSLSSRDLELKILDFYSRANRLLMKLFFEGYKFPLLMDKLQATFMLNDSFIIDNFISSSFNDLRRSKYANFESKLQSRFIDEERKGNHEVSNNDNLNNDIDEEIYLDTLLTVDNTNFYDLAKEILDVPSFDALTAIESSSSQFKTLLNKSLERNMPPSSSSANTAGIATSSYDPDHSDNYTISGLNLQVSIQFPLNILVGQNFIFQYQLMFKLLVLTKFISKLTDNAWKEINYSTVWKSTNYQPKVKKWILRSRILLNRMADFMREMQFYLNSDIIDASYKDISGTMSELEQELKTPQTSSTSRTTGSAFSGAIDSNVYSDRFNTFNNNSIFDKNIIQHQQLQRNVSSASNGGGSSRSEVIDVNILRTKISSFLNNILRHSLVTNKDLIDALKNMYDLIILYSHYLLRLKKSLILINVELYDSFRQDYPEVFEGKSVEQDVIDERYGKLDDRLTWYYEEFSDALSYFMDVLRKFGETEDQSLLILIRRLDYSYPE